MNPDRGGGHLGAQYYGTVLLSGLTSFGINQPILHWIGRPFTAPFAGHLGLGYVDDGYGQRQHSDVYRRGNHSGDVGGALGVEGEQWYFPLGFRPEAGDRAVVRGMWIVDCATPTGTPSCTPPR